MKGFLLVVVFIIVPLYSFSQNNSIEYDYANGNGTILSQTTENGNTIVIRKHEDRLSIYPGSARPNDSLYNGNCIIAYEKPDINSRELFRIKDDGDVNTTQVAFIKNQATNESSNWVKIKTDDNRIGWFNANNSSDAYSNGKWSIMEKINSGKRNWTVRKLDGLVSVWEVLNVRDKPGVNGTNVLFKLTPTKEKFVLFITILAITEERDTIDGITDQWLKIKDDNERTGWVFGGYTTIERGGVKYHTPANDISDMFYLP